MNARGQDAAAGRSAMATVLGIVLLAVALATGAAANADGNYLIVTAQDYFNSTPLNQFIAAKEVNGFTVTTYVATPGTSNTAIRNYIRGLWETANAPDYVLLVGDTAGSTATANTVPYFTGGGSKQAATDWPYVCMDGTGDWYPEIPIGRFSVQTVASLQNVVNKTLLVESGNFPDPDYVRRGAFLANPDTQGTAEPTHDWVIANCLEPHDYTGIKLYASQGANTAAVTAAVNNGCMFTVYFGHSDSSGWWNPAFYQSNVNALNNTGLYTLACGWSCNTARYTNDECFGETWLRAPNKGGVVYISASNYIYWGSAAAWQPSVSLEKAFFSAIFIDEIWVVGDAWVAGLYRFLADYGAWSGNPQDPPAQHLDECRNFFEEFVILGDPGLRLPQGDTFGLEISPPSQSVCAPDDAAYTVQVKQYGTFGEVVSLHVENLPPGASASFSVNGQPPPYTTTLTIGDTDAVIPGAYDIQVVGTSASVQRAAVAHLEVSQQSPAAPALVSPAHGATGVPLSPELVWQAAPGASAYYVELAADPGFDTVVTSATVSSTSYVVDATLAPLTHYYWHVRSENGCGVGPFSAAYRFHTVNRIVPTAYDMLNGETGTYTYFDDTYDGNGNPGQPLSPLSGGLGDLTDGVIATQNWNVTWQPYVGWHTIFPTITFHFDGVVRINSVVFHFDDANGAGGVYPPTIIRLTMGGQVLQFAGINPSGGEPFAQTIEGLDLEGDTLEVYLAHGQTNYYMMVSEIEFYGAPPLAPGDLDCDGDVDFDDIDPFVAALSGQDVYEALFPDCEWLNADVNEDGAVDFDDIDPFVELLTA